MNQMLLKKCPRCNGAVIFDKFYGLHDQFWGWKCLICGEIIDPIILENRELMRTGQGVIVGKGERQPKEKSADSALST